VSTTQKISNFKLTFKNSVCLQKAAIPQCRFKNIYSAIVLAALSLNIRNHRQRDGLDTINRQWGMRAYTHAFAMIAGVRPSRKLLQAAQLYCKSKDAKEKLQRMPLSNQHLLSKQLLSIRNVD
jgi:hypothetical protein